MNHSSNESLSKLEFKNDFISDFAKNKLVEVVRVTNELQRAFENYPHVCMRKTKT